MTLRPQWPAVNSSVSFPFSSLPRNVGFLRRFEDPGHLFGGRRDHFNHVSHVDELEQLLHVSLAHADASVRDVVADGTLIVGAVDAVTFAAESHPASAQGIGFAGGHDFVARAVPGGVGDAGGYPEHARRAWGGWRSYGYGVDFRHAAGFNEGQLAVGNAEDDAPRGLFAVFRGGEGLIPGQRLRGCQEYGGRQGRQFIFTLGSHGRAKGTLLTRALLSDSEGFTGT